MAPSPENDNTPKAPDKNDRTKVEHPAITNTTADLELTGACATDNKEASVSRLDDVELKALLDEAINYKTPKDRFGKSKLFRNLLEKAEEDDRKARATSASGSESVRYYNTSATQRNRRRRETNSVSENLTHGGSLNNLAKEELYAAACQLNRPPKTVSARQRQGGSLPCNVNAGITPSYDKQFFEEARRKTETKKVNEYASINDMESDSLLQYDSLAYNEQQSDQASLPVKYTSKYNLEIGGNDIHKTFFSSFPSYPALVFLGGNGGGNVDDSVTVSALERSDGFAIKPVELITASGHYQQSNNHVPTWPFTKKTADDRRVDENGNALGQTSVDTKKNKKKKVQTDKNVVVVEASNVEGHRSDIINDLDKLIEFIGGKHETNTANTGKTKSNVSKAKVQKNQFADDKSNTNKKQKTRSKSKSEKIHKSNSLEEISVSKLDDFSFSTDLDSGKVVLRSIKSNTERPRERRSWGNSESLPMHASAENLETADFRVVTKKKKSKKGRVCQQQPLGSVDFNRTSSPETRRKSACSVPHSEKSNDSSDVDSVHSLPIEHTGTESSNLPISYADIAKTSNSFDNSNRPKWNRFPSERRTKSVEKSVAVSVDSVIEVSPPSPPLPPPPSPPPIKTKSVNTQTVVRLQQFDSVIDNYCSEVQSWPTIDNQNVNNNKISALSNKNIHKNQKNIKKQVIQNNEPNCINNLQILPSNIPDVQTIEKLHFQQMMQYSSPIPNNYMYPLDTNHVHQQVYNNHNDANIKVSVCSGASNTNRHYIHHQQMPVAYVQMADCDSDRTSSRPPVVILSGGVSKEVPGLTFGFEINEELLSDDVCDIFTSRFFVPNVFQNHDHDKIVNFIGLAWEDIVNQTNGRVKYYNDKL